MSESRLEASVEGIDGIVVERGARLSLENTKFTGGFRRAVMTEGGTVDLQVVSAEGPKTLVHAIDATSRLRGVRSILGSGPALFRITASDNGTYYETDTATLLRDGRVLLTIGPASLVYDPAVSAVSP